MDPERALLLVDAHTRGRESLRESLLTWIRRWLGGLDEQDFYRPPQAALDVVAAHVRTAQLSIAGQTWAYLDALGNVAPGTPTLPAQPRGVDPQDVWERPLKTYRLQRSFGREHDEALAMAVQRAESIADDDLAHAMRLASAEHSTKVKGVTGLRRVVHPEMSRGGTCGLCLAASDRIYRPGTLLPVHDHCKCTVAEITEASDPGNSLNGRSLSDLYEAAGGSTAAADLKATRWKITEHGELGPILTPRRAKPRTEEDVKRDTGSKMPTAEVARRRLVVGEAKLQELEDRAAAGEDVTDQLDYWRRHIKTLRTRAA